MDLIMGDKGKLDSSLAGSFMIAFNVEMSSFDMQP